MTALLPVILATALLRGQVVEDRTLQPLPCRVRILDAAGRHIAPEGHSADLVAREYGQRAGAAKDVIASDRWPYALLPDGRFEVRAPRGSVIRIEVVHGFEHERPILPITLRHERTEVIVRLRRLVDMKALGWMSGDTHVHDLTPQAAWEQGLIADVHVVNLMLIGPRPELTPENLGHPLPPSDARCQIVYSQEVRDHDYGHLTLVGLKRPVEPVSPYTGTGKQLKRPDLPPLANEPRNDEVYDRVHGEGGMVAQAHFTFWPGYGVAASAALGKLDAVEFVGGDPLAVRGAPQVGGFRVLPQGDERYPADLDLYYDMLNSGCRLGVVGGTDLMGNDRLVGHTRTYARVGAARSLNAWVRALKEGRTFATNHPLLLLTVDTKIPGDEIVSSRPLRVRARVRLMTAFPVTKLRLIRDGVVVRDLAVKPTAREAEVSEELLFEGSGWIAAAALDDKHTRPGLFDDAWAWAHTSPVYVTIAGERPAVRPGPERMVRHMDSVLDWVLHEARHGTAESRAAAIAFFRSARDFYARARARALAGGR